MNRLYRYRKPIWLCAALLLALGVLVGCFDRPLPPSVTDSPTIGATDAPTVGLTDAPTHSEAPTETSSEPPTEEPTDAPTEEPTEAPTEVPTEPETESETAPAHQHTPEDVAAITPTWTENGRAEGQVCAECHTILSGAATIPALQGCNGTYGRNFFETMEKGEAYQAFYDRLDAFAEAFHLDASMNAGRNNVAASIPYADLGLTSDEAFAVWITYKADCPAYFWISTSLRYTSESLELMVDPDYAVGTDRVAAWTQMSAAILSLWREEPSAYGLAQELHETILRGMDYAFTASGGAETADWAHSITGYFAYGAGVCETYARTFQLLLNYHGVENIFVGGVAGGDAHAWNLARMDDGRWYWFDLTWDDLTVTLDPDGNESDVLGTLYFCKTDADFTNHTPDTSEKMNLYFQYDLPPRSQEDFSEEALSSAA